MKRRQARLDSVLRLRKRELDGARLALATRVAEAIRSSDTREQFASDAHAAADGLTTQLEGGVRAFELRAGAEAVSRVLGRVREAEERELACRRSVELARQQVAERKGRVRALEIVEAKRRHVEQLREARVLQRGLDEAGARAAAVRREEG